MTKKLIAVGSLIMATFIMAATPQSSNKIRGAFSNVTALSSGATNSIQGESDGKNVLATVTLNKQSEIVNLMIVQGDNKLRLPADAYSGINGTQRAWLEERGALTALVLEGTENEKAWRLALLFHEEQLWKRQLSQEDRRSSMVTYYSRDEGMKPSKPENRIALRKRYNKD
jgi:hypothetical protein